MGLPAGKLIVIEGTDGSGKATQSELLEKALRKAGKKVKLVSFPRYGHPAAYFEERYLAGDFGDMRSVGPYGASLFYALDRFEMASTLRKWLSEGTFVIANRYTTSSMVHQASLLPTQRALKAYLKWLKVTEWVMLGIPQPDLVVFLDVPPAISLDLTEKRSQHDAKRKKDMIEKDEAHMRKAYAGARKVAQSEAWLSIPCVNRGRMLEKGQIAAIILDVVLHEIHS